MTVVDLKTLVLNMAVMATGSKNATYSAEEIVQMAKIFEAYITEGAKVNAKTT